MTKLHCPSLLPLFAVIALAGLVIPDPVQAAQAPPKPLRVLLITGGCCHDYAAQKDILKKGLEARAHVVVDQVHSDDRSTKARFGLYEKPDWAKGYDVVIHDECSADVKDLPYVQNILNAHKTVPAVNLHCAMHCYRTGTDDWFKFVGIQSSGHGPQEPIAVTFVDKEHPVTRGLGDWTTIREELYNNLKIFETAHPLARGKQLVKQKDGSEKEVEYVVAWANQFGNTRVFSTTLGHNNETVNDDRYLKLVLRGLLWSCGKLEDGYLKAYAPPARRVNIAKSKPATASSEEANKGNLAGKAFDGDPATRWCASGPRANEWLQVDLGTPQKLTGCRLTWEISGAVYQHKVEGSPDGKIWFVLKEALNNDKPGVSEHDFNADGVRYVRVTFLAQKGKDSSWGSIRELEIFTDKTEAVDPKQAQREADAEVLRDVKAPAGFEVTLFAQPPMVNYPVFVAAAPDGTLYVSSDGNGSIGRDPHRGRILRLRDTNSDGRADEVKEFVRDVDSPRGLVWDHDRLYLLHPPNLSAFIDRNSDGVADEEKVLVKGIAFSFKDRPADHSSNGIELGVDGWIYCAIGDFGFMEAEGTDGRKLQLRGGGIVRVRPDGTDLELFARGTRNILEGAVSPLLDIFARDNTNDGGGWDTRLHHFTGLEEHGYPSLFRSFADDIIQPLADYGGGSGCGAAWIDEPGIPQEWNNAPFTADWGRSWVYWHGLTAKGSTFTADQREFLGATRVTDLDVDALSRIYVSSWKGATFNWVGPDVGYLVRLTPKGYQPVPLPNYDKAGDAELVKLLESPSQRRRLEAQRALLGRGLMPETVNLLTTMATDKVKPLASRVAALFALKQGLGAKSTDTLAVLAADPTIAAWAIRALTDREDQLAGVPAAPVLDGLKSSDARTRREAAVAAARLGSRLSEPPQAASTAMRSDRSNPALVTGIAAAGDSRDPLASALTALLGDGDPVVTHTAVQALKRLKAADACFAVMDTSGASPQARAGALRVLRSLHDAKVVDGLTTRLHREMEAGRRNGLLTALCRLYHREGQWKGDSWGTRPDTTGPYYQAEEWSETPKIAAALKAALAQARGGEAAHLVAEFNRHKIQSDDTLNTVITLATKDPSLVTAAVGQLSRSDRIPAAALPLLMRTATAETTSDIPRACAIIALAKTDSVEAFKAAMIALPMLGRINKEQNNGTERERRLAREAFFNAPKLDAQHAMFEREAVKGDELSVWADAALLKIADRKGGSPEAREAAKHALNAGWTNPKRRTQILHAVQLAEFRPYKDKVLEALGDADKNVVAAARRAAGALRLEKTDGKTQGDKQTVPLIATLKASEVVAQVLKTHGDVKLGEQLFAQQGCANCHTVRTDEPQRGPFLGNIAATYKRPELAENILLPSKTIAQGFTSWHFELKDETEIDGFVTSEAADQVIVRNAAAQEFVIKTSAIVKREKKDVSIMPEGLAANLTVKEFAALLDYLEMLAKQEIKVSAQ